MKEKEICPSTIRTDLTDAELRHELANCEMTIQLLDELLSHEQMKPPHRSQDQDEFRKKLEDKKQDLEKFKVSLMNVQALNEVLKLSQRFK